MLDFTQFSVPALLTQDVVTLVFYFILAAYTLFSGVFYYHWEKYATDGKVTAYTLTLYFVLTLPLLAIMGILTFFVI